MKFYLAGKIEKNDWRSSIVSGIGDHHKFKPICRGNSDVANQITSISKHGPLVQPKVINGEHDYCGPFFIRCDHGCFHGPNEHGIGASQMNVRQQVFSMCLWGIQKADIVFAWIDNPTCYGTLAELGFAFGELCNNKKKSIWIAGPKEFDDLWFVYKTCHKLAFDYPDAKTAFFSFLASDLSSMPYSDYLRTNHWQTKRKESLERAGQRCQVCNAGNKTLDVHHRTYERRGCEEPGDLTVLCRSCHEKFHEELISARSNGLAVQG